MLRQLYFQLFILLLIATSSYAQPDATLDEKVHAVNNTVADLYEAYSFEGGSYPAIGDILEHFTEDASLSYLSKDSLVTLPVADFFDLRQKNNRENGIEYLQEVELRGRTEAFNSIAHRISSVEFTTRGKKESSGRAVISLQLHQANGRWYVHTMLWESLGEGESLPERFRKRE